MNPVFIILSENLEINFPPNKYVKIFNQDNYSKIEDVEKEYMSFRNDVMGIAGDANVNDEILFVCIRNVLHGFEKSTQFVKKLIKNSKSTKDVEYVFFVDILNSLTEELSESFYITNSQIPKDFKARIYNIIFSRKNINNREVDEKDMFLQVESFLNLLSNNFRLMLDYIKPSNPKQNILYNAIGSSQISFPNKKIEESIFYLTNASQFYYLLFNERFDKDEFYNISAKIPLLDDKSKVDKILIHEYSKVPDEVNVIASVNELYDDCDIDNITNTFDNIDSFPFSDFISKEENLSAVKIEATHNDYMLDVIQRTTNAKEETNRFFEAGSDLFRDYRNDKIISIQKNLNKQKKDKKKAIFNAIDNYSNNLISTDYKNLSDGFGATTTFEALIKSLSYFASGSENYVSDHDKYLSERIKKITKENPAELAVNRRKLFKRFHDANNQYKKSIETIDNELEDIKLEDTNLKDSKLEDNELEDTNLKNAKLEDNELENNNVNTGFRKLIEQRKQLSFNLIYKEAGILKKDRYSFLQLTTALSIVAGVLLFFSAYYVFKYFGVEKSLKLSLLIGFIPILVGIIPVVKRVIEYKKLKKYIESLISQKVGLLNAVISNHDNFIKSYISQVKIEYTLEIIKDIQKYCKLKVYKLTNFRKYLLNHYIYSINKYNAVDFGNSVFDFSLLNKNQFEKYFFEDSISSYFEKRTKDKLNFFNLYIEKSKSDIDYGFSPNKLNIKFFDENEIAYDKVEPLENHKSKASYRNDFDKQAILFMSNDDNPEPIILEDINQGEVGNCYFMASIGAFAHSNPAYIRKMITCFDLSDDIAEEETESTDQSFLVKFFDEERNERFVAVDNKFWFYNESFEPVYARFGYQDEDNYEIWPMILEKAWAKVNNGYKEIVGSTKNEKFSIKQMKLDFGLALSGNYIDYKSFSEFKDDTVLTEIISSNFKEDIPMVVYSKETPEDSSVVNFHAYTVKGIENDKITLYNPHGANHLADKPVSYLTRNFDTLLTFTLDETSELIIPPTEKVKYIDHIAEIEENLRLFFGGEIFKKIRKIPIPDLLNDQEFNEVIKKIDKSSIPLINNVKIKEETSILFTDFNNIKTTMLKNNPNDTKPKVSDDIYLLLTKFMSWEISV